MDVIIAYLKKALSVNIMNFYNLSLVKDVWMLIVLYVHIIIKFNNVKSVLKDTLLINITVVLNVIKFVLIALLLLRIVSLLIMKSIN